MGSGPKFDPADTTPMPAGSFVTHFGKQVHWDGAKDEETVLLIMGEGPATAFPRRGQIEPAGTAYLAQRQSGRRDGSGATMHPAANVPFERIVREFAQWRMVPEQERSPAPAWWWGPAFEMRGARQPMPAEWCSSLELPDGSSSRSARR